MVRFVTVDYDVKLEMLAVSEEQAGLGHKRPCCRLLVLVSGQQVAATCVHYRVRWDYDVQENQSDQELGRRMHDGSGRKRCQSGTICASG